MSKEQIEKVMRHIRKIFPVITVLIICIIHKIMPDKQDLGYSYYPKVLIGIAFIYSVFYIISFRSRKIESFLSYKSYFICGLLILVEIYDVVTLKLNILPLPFFPSPDRMIFEFVDGYDMLGISVLYSLRLLLTGFVIGSFLGFITGVCLGWSKRCSYWIEPLMRFVGPIPSTALIPIAMVAFPTSFMSSVFIIVFGVWFPVTIMTAAGIEGCRKSWLEGAMIMGADNRQLVFHVAVPAAMPSIHTGLFMGLSNSFVTLVTAEMMGVKAGLGWYIRWATNWANYAKIYDAILIMAVLFSGMIKLQFFIRDRQLRWQEGIVK